MGPDLEVIQIRPGESFAAKAHGFPYHTVRWHFHPEFEIHQIVATRGRCFVGDFIGEFEPGNLVLAGPNLPHNWISDVPHLEIAGLGHGADPVSDGFGARVISAAGADGHPGYFAPGTTSLANFTRIALGRYGSVACHSDDPCTAGLS